MIKKQCSVEHVYFFHEYAAVSVPFAQQHQVRCRNVIFTGNSDHQQHSAANVATQSHPLLLQRSPVSMLLSWPHCQGDIRDWKLWGRIIILTLRRE